MLLSTKLTKQADIWGSVSSVLCLVHCLITPLFFSMYAHNAVAKMDFLVWWSSLDVIFLALSFLAILSSVSNTSKVWVRYALWGNWGLLAIIILNERFSLMHLPEEVVFIPTIGLIALHLYNRKYCQCKNENCCANT